MTTSLFAQGGWNDNEVRDCVKDFFKVLYDKDKVTIKDFAVVYYGLPSLEAEYRKDCFPFVSIKEEYRLRKIVTVKSNILIKMRSRLINLLGKDKLESILNKIDSAEIFHDGVLNERMLVLKTYNGELIHILIVDGTIVGDVYLPNGNSLNQVILRKDVIYGLRRVGLINDPDGYVNVRESGSIDGRVIGKIKENELFYYRPIGNINWYPVYKTNNFMGQLGVRPIWGYIHKSRITKFKDFPEDIKKTVIESRTGY